MLPLSKEIFFSEFNNIKNIKYISNILVLNFDTLDSIIQNEFINRINNKNYYNSILFSISSDFPYYNKNTKVNFLNKLFESNTLLSKRAISKLIKDDAEELQNGLFEKIDINLLEYFLEKIYLSDDDKTQIYISKILICRFNEINELFRKILIDRMLYSDKNYLYLNPIIKKNNTEVKELLYSKANLLLEKSEKDFENNKAYILDILDSFFPYISKELREKTFFILLNNKENLSRLAKILKKNINIITIDIKILYNFIYYPKSLKTLIKFILKKSNVINLETIQFLLNFSSNDNISHFIVWQILNNSNNIPKNILEELLNKFQNTNNTQTAKILVLALFNSDSNIPYEKKEHILFNLLSNDSLNDIIYKNMFKIYDNLTVKTKNKLIIFLSSKNKDKFSIMLSILKNKNNSFQIIMLKSLFDERKGKKDAIKLLKSDFELFPESLRNQLIIEYFKEEKLKKEVVHIIIKNAKNLPLEINNLIFDVFEKNINMKKTITELIPNNIKKLILKDYLKDFFYSKEEKYTTNLFLRKCLYKDYRQIIINSLLINNFEDNIVFESINNLAESREILNFLANTLRTYFYKLPINISIELIKRFIDYEDEDEKYIYNFIVDTIKYNADKIPKEIILSTIEKIKNTNIYTNKIVEDLKTLI